MISKYIGTCNICQRFERGVKEQDELQTPEPSGLFEKFGFDIVHMPEGRNGLKYILHARDDPSGWSEAKATSSKNSQVVLKFLQDFIYKRYGSPTVLTVDNREACARQVRKYVESMGTELRTVSA